VAPAFGLALAYEVGLPFAETGNDIGVLAYVRETIYTYILIGQNAG
jgi:hypothetical protein